MTEIDACFDKIGEQTEYGDPHLQKSNKIITNWSSKTWNTGYISLLIEPNKHNTFIAKFKIIKCSSIVIGIQCGRFNSQNGDFSEMNNKQNCYGYHSNGKLYDHNNTYGRQYLPEYSTGDEIELKLEFSEFQNFGTLCYCLNGTYFKDTSYRISKNEKIKIAVATGGNNSVELLTLMMENKNINNIKVIKHNKKENKVANDSQFPLGSEINVYKNELNKKETTIKQLQSQLKIKNCEIGALQHEILASHDLTQLLENEKDEIRSHLLETKQANIRQQNTIKELLSEISKYKKNKIEQEDEKMNDENKEINNIEKDIKNFEQKIYAFNTKY
eukprot:378230_1